LDDNKFIKGGYLKTKLPEKVVKASDKLGDGVIINLVPP
jgi:hypothetical protein